GALSGSGSGSAWNLTTRRLPPYASLVIARALDALAIGFLVCASARPAIADDNDLSLSRFVKPAPPDAMGHVPLGAAAPDAAAQTRFRALASELGVVLAPKLLAPADTIGFGGFQFSIDVAFTSIAQKGDYWDAARRVDPQNPMVNRPPAFMNTLGVFVRKGLWLPLPLIEVGAGAMRMGDFNVWEL